MVVKVEVDALAIDWLVNTARCLDEERAMDAREIGAAITRAIAVSSRS
jgi:NaMN:DMB phosphoribosyltransferase